MISEEIIQKEIRDFLITAIFNGDDKQQLKNDTKLISSRMMDSIVALKLVSHLEEKFGIEFEAHEVDQDNLESIDAMVKFVQSKMK